MGNTVANLTDVSLEAEYKEIYIRMRLFGGLIKWWKLVRLDRIKPTLHIKTTEDFEKVIINGVEYRQLDEIE